MKKVIAGKLYNTDTAENMGEYLTTHSARSFEDYTETLYRKRTGEFFLYGEGGPLSKYAVSLGNGDWSGSEVITPLSYDRAAKWAAEYLSGDEYEEIFGKIPEDETRTGMTISVANTTAEAVRRAAAKANSSVSALIEKIITENIEKY